MKHEGLIREAAAIGVVLDPSQADQLLRYEDLLRERAAPLGMVAAGDVPRLRERHILDSLRAALAVPADAVDVADLGSGAGLPGIPLAVARPGLRVTLAETRRQRIAFLELVADELGLPGVAVFAGRAEQAPGPVDACLARAFRAPADSWAVAEALLRPGGCPVYFAGRRFDPDEDVPAGVAARALPTSPLANSGPLVIMTRQ